MTPENLCQGGRLTGARQLGARDPGPFQGLGGGPQEPIVAPNNAQVEDQSTRLQRKRERSPEESLP
jgi:hypothetical protein